MTIATLKKMQADGEKIACLTAYDASFASLQDAAGVDVLLVGDSLGMVLHGDDTTLAVTMTDMIYHTRWVSRACRRAGIISDMPYQSYTTATQALENAKRLVNAGADMVKLEGGATIRAAVKQIAQHDIPVCGHLGLLPQSIHEMGGYRVQARTKATAGTLKQEAMMLQQSGASCLVLECVPARVAAEVTATLNMPVIGIGAGPDCDGQVLVVYDMLGITRRQFKFSRNFLIGKDSIADAFKDYVAAVKNKSFPTAAESYT